MKNTKWKKNKILGYGSFGTVYLATPAPGASTFWSSSADSTVAVKSADIRISRTLQREGMYLSELRGYPNIIHCFGNDISVENGKQVYNLLLEYAPGGNLHDLIQENKGSIGEPLVASYTSMLLKGLSAIHEQNIVHCDLKPDNILVFPTQDGINQLKIADFGVAKGVDEVSCKCCGYRGTTLYASPESMWEAIHETSTDIWSLGCIVIEMITGTQPWSDYGLKKDLLSEINRCEPKILENISEEGNDFLRRCLIREYSDRWTADMLLNHPFIVKNMELLYGNDNGHPSDCCLVLSRTNPFGPCSWTSTCDLFSTSEEYKDEGSKLSQQGSFVGLIDRSAKLSMNAKWKKHESLGMGSHGTVYLATPNVSTFSSNPKVAVKSADINLSLSLQIEGIYLSELRGYPNIIHCFGSDISVENGKKVYNLLLEYAPGGSLDDLIGKGSIGEQLVALYTSMLLRGLSVIHEENIVHCDLKPGNILVFPTHDGVNQLKIADFGLAKKVTSQDGKHRGTVSYASPESVLSGIQVTASDIWSLGCLVVKMITGKQIWSIYKNRKQLLSTIKLPKTKILENMSEEGNDFLTRCFVRDFRNRWTAEMLLNHPFIVQNLELLYGSDHGPRDCCQVLARTNPFGPCSWASTFDLFSTI